MKVLLIQPPFTIFKTETKKCHPPLGLAYLAAILKDDFKVKILDCLAEGYEKEEIIDRDFLRYGLSFDDIKKEITAFNPDVVAISCLFSNQVENVYKIFQLIKDIDNEIITIIGGAHPSAVPEEVLNNKNIDFVIIGEGEVTLKRLLEAITAKKEFHHIEGLGFRINGRIYINPKLRYEENLDNLPFPYWEIFPLEKYFKINNPHGSPAKRVPFLPIITSRGCPFECIFCSVYNLWGRDYRVRSPENILLEIGHLINKFGIKEIMFEDDNLMLDKARALKIFQGMIDREFNLSWSVPNGVGIQTLDNQLLDLIKRSGCYSISLGIESGDEYVLKNIIKKPIMLSQVRPVINKANKLGLKISVFFVVGLPGEKYGHLKNTFLLAESLNVDNVNFFFAAPLPGTRLFQFCKERGLISDPLDYNYYRMLKSDNPNFATEEFSISELNSIVIREKFKIHLLYLLRNPIKFIYKFYDKLRRDPGYFFRYALQIFSKKINRKTKHAINKTISNYNFLWSQHRSLSIPKEYHFNFMQEVIPEKIVRGNIGLDLGCGCGWDTFIMAKENPLVKILGIDLSDGVYTAHRLNWDLNNVSIVKGSTEAIPLKNGICDFVYSFGVLHHTPDYKKGLFEIARVLKNRGRYFLYLYEDHSENLIKYIAVKMVKLLRFITVRINLKILFVLCWLASPFIFIVFSLPAKLLRQFRATQDFAKKIPFNFGSSPFSLSTDLYDRFSTPIEHRFSRKDVYAMMSECGFNSTHITRLKDTAGWVIWGDKE